MKTRTTLRHGLLLAASGVLLATASASAQSTLTWDITPGTVGAGNGTITGGTGAWNTTNGNWTTDAGANNIAWDNTSPSLNTAIFGGTAGTVTLGEAINIKTLSLTNLSTSNKYTIQGSTLNFASGGSITTASTNAVNFNDYAFITSAITGAPNIVHGFSGANNQLVFAPSSGSVVLGTISGSGVTRLAGSTTGNSLVGTSNTNAKIKVSSGTWTLTGTANGYEHFIEGGNLIISTGTLQHANRAISLIGGTLHYNNPAAVRSGTAAGGDGSWRLRGGSLDNTSGAAITTSTWNPGMNFENNLTFIGSNGAASNLYMGTGNLFLNNATRQVTVQNGGTTLAFGGVISNGGLTKAGAGALELRGNSTYTGATLVSAGTLAVNGSLANTATTVESLTSVRLQGAGLIVGSLTIGDNGTLAPGNSIESLGVGALTFDANSTFDFEFQPDLFAGSSNLSADLVYSTGSLTITSGAELKLYELGTPNTPLAVDSKLTLIKYTGGATSGRFTLDGSTLADGDTRTIGANTWKFKYADTSGGPNFAADQIGAGNYFTMTVVPEAGTAGLLALGLLLVRLLRRRVD